MGIFAEHYGPGHLLHLIQKLYTESVIQGGSLVEHWIEKRRLKQTVSILLQYITINPIP